MFARKIVPLLLVLISSLALAENFRLDSQYANQGMLRTGLGPSYLSPREPAIFFPDGSSAILQLDSITRYLPDGGLDHHFGVNGKVSLPNQLGSEPILFTGGVGLGNGGILLAAQRRPANYRGYNAGALLRLTPEGRLDERFGSGGSLKFNARPEGAPLIANEGKIFVSGGCSVNEFRSQCVHSFLIDGSRNSGFNDGRANLGNPYGNEHTAAGGGYLADILQIRRIPNGGILVLGADYKTYIRNGVYNTERIISVRKLGFDGKPALGFGTNGRVTLTASVTPYLETVVNASLSANADGRIVVAWDIFRDQRSHLIRATVLNASGAIDSSFGKGGLVETRIIPGADLGDVRFLGRGSILLGGKFGLLKLHSDGTPDEELGPAGRYRYSERADGVTVKRFRVGQDRRLTVFSTALNADGSRKEFVLFKHLLP